MNNCGRFFSFHTSGPHPKAPWTFPVPRLIFPGLRPNRPRSFSDDYSTILKSIRLALKGVARREFLRRLAAASTAALAAGEPRLLAEAAEKSRSAEATGRCRPPWMGGGMGAPDTFDPKLHVPFRSGLPITDVMSTFPAIDTVVPRLKISEGLENVARVMDRATSIRSHVQPDSGASCTPATSITGTPATRLLETVACPHLGAWMAKVLGPQNSMLPFINIGQRLEGVGEQEELKAFTTAGFLAASSVHEPPLPGGGRRSPSDRRRAWTPGDSRAVTSSSRSSCRRALSANS